MTNMLSASPLVLRLDSVHTLTALCRKPCARQVSTFITLLETRLRWPAFRDENPEQQSYGLLIDDSLLINASDAMELAFGLAHLHRTLRISHLNGTLTLPRRQPPPLLKQPPLWHLRGHQISVKHHPSFFRNWSALREFVTELAVFGTNQIEAAHVTPTDASGALPVDDLVQLSSVVDSVGGVNFSLWGAASLFERAGRETLFARSSRIDSLFFPGGDGGSLNWTSIAATATALRRYPQHKAAAVWVSAQELNSTALSEVFQLLRQNASVRELLGRGGAVYGPHNNLPLTRFVAALGSGSSVHVRQYPDLSHGVDAQFALPRWDAPWPMAYGRQVVNPLPTFFGRVVRERANGSTSTVGVGAYSEGLSDDLNKHIWSSLAHRPHASVEEIVHEYSAFYFGADAEKTMATALMGLENNWHGLARDAAPTVARTLRLLERAERTIAQAEEAAEEATGRRRGEERPRVVASRWRLAMYLRRGYMDAYVQSAHAHDVSAAEAAEALLRNASAPMVIDEIEPAARAAAWCDGPISAAEAMLRAADPSEAQRRLWRTRIDRLTAELNATVGAEVVQAQDTHLNLDTLDSPSHIYRRYWLWRLLSIRKLPTDTRCAALRAELSWRDPGAGGFYDNLGSIVPSERPHLVSDASTLEADPSSYYHPLQGGYSGYGVVTPYPPPDVRPAWLRYSMAFYDAPLVLRYPDIDPTKAYTLNIAYWPCIADCEDDAFQLVANGRTIVHGWRSAPNPMSVLRLPIPTEETRRGVGLELACRRRAGGGGNGKTCQVSEAWLVVDAERGGGES